MTSSVLLAFGLPAQLDECRQKPLPEGWSWICPEPQALAQVLPGAAGIFIFDDHTKVVFPYNAVPQGVPVFVNHVQGTLADFPAEASIIRMNAWPGFFAASILELSAAAGVKAMADTLLTTLGWSREWIPDDPGMVRPRVISMIINEACFARGESVSSAEEIDIAMKLGTNYPRGPFEWARLIGAERITGLLAHLSSTDPRYTPAPGMPDILQQQT